MQQHASVMSFSDWIALAGLAFTIIVSVITAGNLLIGWKLSGQFVSMKLWVTDHFASKADLNVHEEKDDKRQTEIMGILREREQLVRSRSALNS